MMDWWIDETPPRPGDSEEAIAWKTIFEPGQLAALNSTGVLVPAQPGSNDPNIIGTVINERYNDDGSVILNISTNSGQDSIRWLVP